MGLKLAIVVFSFQLSHISIFRAYGNLVIACIRFGGAMSPAGSGSCLFNVKEYLPHGEKPPIIHTSDTMTVVIGTCGTQSLHDLNGTQIAT